MYYAQYTPDHDEKKLSGLIGLGEWGEGREPEHRLAFPFQIWADENNFEVGLIDAKDSPWSHVSFLGRIFDRAEALKDDWIKEVFHITDHLVTDDAEITKYFGSHGT